jgi:hypothetical protein
MKYLPGPLKKCIDSIFRTATRDGTTWDPDTQWDERLFPTATLLPHPIMLLSKEEIDAHIPERCEPLYNKYVYHIHVVANAQHDNNCFFFLAKPKDGPKNAKTSFKPIIFAGNRCIHLPELTDRMEGIMFVYADIMIIYLFFRAPLPEVPRIRRQVERDFMRSKEVWRSATYEEMERGQMLLLESKPEKIADPKAKKVDLVAKREQAIANGVSGWQQKMDRPGPEAKHPSEYVDPWNKWRSDGKCGQICGKAIQEGDDEDMEIQPKTRGGRRGARRGAATTRGRGRGGAATTRGRRAARGASDGGGGGGRGGGRTGLGEDRKKKSPQKRTSRISIEEEEDEEPAEPKKKAAEKRKKNVEKSESSTSAIKRAKTTPMKKRAVTLGDRRRSQRANEQGYVCYYWWTI